MSFAENIAQPGSADSAGSEELFTILAVPARDRDDPNKLTLTLRGPKTADRERVLRVLANLLADDSEWNTPRPNVDFVVESVAK